SAAGLATGRSATGFGADGASAAALSSRGAPQNLQKRGPATQLPWQREHVTSRAGAAAARAPLTTGPPADRAAARARAVARGPGAGGGAPFCGLAAGVASVEPHVTQKRYPGGFAAPHEAHEGPPAFGASTGGGAGVGGLVRGFSAGGANEKNGASGRELRGRG